MLSLLLLFSALVFNLTVNEESDRVKVNLICLLPLGLFAAVDYLVPDMGDGYFLLSCVLSLFVVVALGLLKRSPLSTHIQIINMMAMPIHLYGLYCFYNFMDYQLYTILITFAIILEWLRLMIRTKTDGIYWSNIWLRINSGDANCSSKRGDS